MYPEVRCDDLFVEATEEGLIIYDLERHQIHALNGPASQIFRSSDGKTPLGDYPQLAPDLHDPRANVAVVEYGLHRLSQKRLLTAPFTSHLTRRQLLASVRALGVASAPFILPVISTIVAPTPLSAQSTVASCIGNPGACLTGPIATSEICAALGVPGCGSGNPGDIATPPFSFFSSPDCTGTSFNFSIPTLCGAAQSAAFCAGGQISSGNSFRCP